MSHSDSHTSCIILCGGSARRLGGIEKPLLEIKGVPMVATLAARLKDFGPILISANRERQRYQAYGEVVADAEPDQGPLAGLYACLQRVGTNRALVIPGDCPDYSSAVAERLLQRLSEQPVQVVCAHDGQQQQFLHLAIESSVLGSIKQYLADGGRSVKGWLKQIPLEIVDCSDLAAVFTDIDSPDDLHRHRGLLDP